MTHKVYLITHLDNGMKYVGYTSKDLRTRWQQHCNDPKSAVYDAIRREGYRMTMELLGEFDTEIDALRKEQEYIRTLNTLEPNGWNRIENKRLLKNTINYVPITLYSIKIKHVLSQVLRCPRCQCIDLKFYLEDGDVIARHDCNFSFTHGLTPNRIGTGFYVVCKKCHKRVNDERGLQPFQVLIEEIDGRLHFNIEYYERSLS